MNNNGRPGFLRRAWSALGVALKRAVLGKSTHAYRQQFTGSDEYFEEAIAAQLRWPQQRVSKLS